MVASVDMSCEGMNVDRNMIKERQEKLKLEAIKHGFPVWYYVWLVTGFLDHPHYYPHYLICRRRKLVFD